jgi:membrane-associated PAP2 superfamily phosphatase
MSVLALKWPAEYPTKGLIRLTALLLGLGILTWVAAFFDVDRRLASIFYRPDMGWYLRHSQPWAFLYKYGPLPGLAMSFMALVGFGLGYRYRRVCLCAHRKQMLVVGLTCLLGAGLIVNGLLKPGWGRPRPRQVVEFGGALEFKHPFQPGTPGQGESFPSGHASMGFLFVTLACFRSLHRSQVVLGVAIGILYGSLIGFGRMVQGGHFFTDILWSFGIVSAVALALNDLILPKFLGRTAGRVG